MATRTQLRTNLLLRLGGRTEIDNPRLDAWLNDGLLDLTTKRVHLRSLETTDNSFQTQPGDTSYPLPDNAFALTEVVDNTSLFVLSRFPGEWREYQWAIQHATPGHPVYFIEYGANRFWYPTVDAVYTMTDHYYARPTFGGQASDVPNIEPEWHYAIELVAAIHAFRDIGDQERASVAEQEFNSWLVARDTPNRRTRRTTIPSHGIRPHYGLRNTRTGV